MYVSEEACLLNICDRSVDKEAHCVHTSALAQFRHGLQQTAALSLELCLNTTAKGTEGHTLKVKAKIAENVNSLKEKTVCGSYRMNAQVQNSSQYMESFEDNCVSCIRAEAYMAETWDVCVSECTRADMCRRKRERMGKVKVETELWKQRVWSLPTHTFPFPWSTGLLPPLWAQVVTSWTLWFCLLVDFHL